MEKRDNKMKSLCGIDEAGRGPLAGPLVMAGVILKNPVEGLTDSKKLTEKRREILFGLIRENALYHLVSFSADEIDRVGISCCLRRGLEEIQASLPECHYLFDGNSTFGATGVETMVKADEKVPEVSAASILAKVTRDREMVRQAKYYPHYGFEKHKGYGTKAHIDALMRYGRSPLHRRSFRVKGLEDKDGSALQ